MSTGSAAKGQNLLSASPSVVKIKGEVGQKLYSHFI